MNLTKKSTRPFSPSAFSAEEEFAAILEPKSGCSPAQVEEVARATAASQLEWLDATKLSAIVKRAALEKLTSVANVSPKRRKVLH